MPNFSLVSAKGILARVIRATGYKLPSTYHDDLLEWIPEALGMLQVTNTLTVTSTGDVNCPGELLVRNHCVPLPCGFVTVIAIEDENGSRLPEGGDVTDITSQTSLRHNTNTNNARVNVFEVNPFVHQTEDGLPTDEPGTTPPWYRTGVDLTLQPTSPTQKDYYKIQGNYLQTSFECGFVKMHYYQIPVDSEGYPLIPNNENFKQALEWHIIRRLIGAGYEHKVFDYKYANEQFEIYAARGMGEVSYPTPDTMARINHSTVRLIPPTHFSEDFFVNSEQPERLFK